MWETIWSVSEASTLQNSMNVGISSMISRTVILSNIFPGQLLLATWKRLLLKRKDTTLWVSERKRNHRNDSKWFSESLKTYLPHGWLTGQVREWDFINMALNSQESKETLRLCGAWKTRGWDKPQGCSTINSAEKLLGTWCLVVKGVEDKAWGPTEGPVLQQITDPEHAKWTCS